MSRDSSGVELAKAARLLGKTGALVPAVCFAGVTFDAVVSINWVEHNRRQVYGLGPVVDRYLWEILGELPVGMAVPLESVDIVKRVLLDGAKPGIFDMGATHVTRDLDIPLQVRIVLKKAKSWKAALEAISRFSSLSQRAIVLDSYPGSAALRETESLGVGAVLQRDDVYDILAPALATRPRVGTFYSRFLEAAYAKWVEDRQSAPSPRP